MKVLFWTLLFCAVHHLSFEATWKLVDKSWNTLYLVSNNKAKISGNGYLRFYIRGADCNEQNKFYFTFYLRIDGTCQRYTGWGLRTDPLYYIFNYRSYLATALKKAQVGVREVTQWVKHRSSLMGVNYVTELRRFGNMRVIFLINIGRDSLVTCMLIALSKNDDLSPEEYEYFKEKAQEWVIPIKNIVKMAGTDVCPRD